MPAIASAIADWAPHCSTSRRTIAGEPNTKRILYAARGYGYIQDAMQRRRAQLIPLAVGVIIAGIAVFAKTGGSDPATPRRD